jgi:hypothetical protein
MFTSCQANKAEVSSLQQSKLIHRPTHDQIEQLQGKINHLESLLSSLSNVEPLAAADTIRSWRQDGLIDLPASHSGRPHQERIDVSTADEAIEAPATFDTPPTDQYIYDNTG